MPPTTPSAAGRSDHANQSNRATTPLDLSPETITAIAERVVELLAGDAPTRQAALVDAETLARRLKVSRDTVYRHAPELGGQRVGDGPRGRLRFDLDHALEAWSSRYVSERSQPAKPPTVAVVSRRRRRGSSGSGRTLLPVHGDPLPGNPENGALS